MPKKTTDPILTFEKNLSTLTELVDAMEAGGLSLADALAHYEEGVKLINACQEALNNAEQTVKTLTEKAGAFALEEGLSSQSSS